MTSYSWLWKFQVVAFEVDGVTYVDGSLSMDLPFKRMATLFNVSNFIVSQVILHRIFRLSNMSVSYLRCTYSYTRYCSCHGTTLPLHILFSNSKRLTAGCTPNESGQLPRAAVCAQGAHQCHLRVLESFAFSWAWHSPSCQPVTTHLLPSDEWCRYLTAFYSLTEYYCFGTFLDDIID